mgnify:CR=1 FL=1
MSRRKIVLYVYGPYSGDVDRNIEMARETAGWLWQQGFTAYCPHLNTAHFDRDFGLDYEDFMAGDCEFIRRCDALVPSTNDREKMIRSRGSMREEELAKLDGILVFRTKEEVLKYDWR